MKKHTVRAILVLASVLAMATIAQAQSKRKVSTNELKPPKKTTTMKREELQRQLDSLSRVMNLVSEQMGKVADQLAKQLEKEGKEAVRQAKRTGDVRYIGTTNDAIIERDSIVILDGKEGESIVNTKNSMVRVIICGDSVRVEQSAPKKANAKGKRAVYSRGNRIKIEGDSVSVEEICENLGLDDATRRRLDSIISLGVEEYLGKGDFSNGKISRWADSIAGRMAVGLGNGLDAFMAKVDVQELLKDIEGAVKAFETKIREVIDGQNGKKN